MPAIYNSGVEIPCIPIYMDDPEEDHLVHRDDNKDDWRTMTFLAISSYGKVKHHEYGEGTLFVSDSMEYFTNVDVFTFESALAQARYNDMMNNTLMFHKN